MNNNFSFAEEAGEFDQEWQQRTRTHQSGRSLGAHRRQHDRPRAITDGHIRYKRKVTEGGWQNKAY